MLGESPVWPAKAPAEYSDYGFRWKKYLPEGDKVVQSDWFVESELSGDETPIVANNKAIVENGLVTVAWLGEGQDGVTYYITNRVVTEGGRTLELSSRITVSTDRL